VAEGARLESVCRVSLPRVRIPPSPFDFWGFLQVFKAGQPAEVTFEDVELTILRLSYFQVLSLSKFKLFITA
jgi:hypothetical protein